MGKDNKDMERCLLVAFPVASMVYFVSLTVVAFDFAIDLADNRSSLDRSPGNNKPSMGYFEGQTSRNNIEVVPWAVESLEGLRNDDCEMENCDH